MRSPLTTAVCLSLLCIGIPAVSGGRSMKHFTMHTPLYSLHVNAGDRMVYAGGRDVLLQLDWDLNLINKVERVDAPCGSEGECPDGSTPPQPNDIKLVEVSDRLNQLFVCGTARHGACSLHSPTNISHYWDLTGQSTGAFVGSRKSSIVHLSSLADDVLGDVVYVFHEYDGRDARFAPLALSARRLNGTDHTLNYLTGEPDGTRPLQTSGLDVHPSHKRDYYMSFVYTFRRGSHLYFLMNQQESLANENQVRIRLGRINYGRNTACLSYIEIEIFCYQGDVLFNKVVTAAFDDDNLYVSAMKLHNSSREQIVKEMGSAIFKFPLSALDDCFKEGTALCYSGKEGQVPEWSTDTVVKCKNEQLGVTEEQLCVPQVSPAIRWAKNGCPAGVLLKQLDATLVTAIKPFKNGGNSLLLVGDEEGNIRKLDISSAHAREYLKVNIGAGPIRGDLAEDTEGDIFVLAGEKIVKFPAATCSFHADCEACVTSGDPLGCGWCDGACTSAAECAASNTLWQSGSGAACPPTIFSVSPINGPTKGGTLLTVAGKNFGTKIEQIKVSIDKIACEVTNLSMKFDRIVCKTRPSSGEMTGAVRVEVRDNTVPPQRQFRVEGHDEAEDTFSFKTPSIAGFKPTRGPQSGGSVITIKGNNLDIGSGRKVLVSGYQCAINNASISATELQCTTQQWPQRASKGRRSANRAVHSGLLSVSIDDHVMMSGASFSYHHDPQIFDVHLRKSIISGGIPITVTGSHLDASENPLMTGETTGNKSLGVNTTCRVNADGTEMVCPSMDVRGAVERKGAKTYISFIYDGARWPKVQESYSAFQYNEDPSFFPFPFLLYKFDVDKDEMKFRGLNILQAEQKDYQVLVGKQVCAVVELELYKLECRPDLSGLDVGDGTKYEIQIKVGNLVFNSTGLGLVELVREDAEEISWPTFAIIISCIALGCIIFGAIFCYRKIQNARHYRRHHKNFVARRTQALQQANSNDKTGRPPGEETLPLGEFPN